MSQPVPPAADAVRESVLSEVRRVEQALGCTFGLCVRRRSPAVEIAYRADELFHAASTMKVPVMIEVFRQAEQGRFKLSDTVAVEPICRSFLDGSPFHCEPDEKLREHLGGRVTILYLMEEMIQASDNLATNLLMQMVGAENVNAAMRGLGAHNCVILRGVMDEKAYQAGLSNLMTARDLVIVMESIDCGRAAGEKSCREMMRILEGQRHRRQIPALMPADVQVGNKTGSITGIRNDGAIVRGPRMTLYLAFLMKNVKDDEAAIAAQAQLARFIYDSLGE